MTFLASVKTFLNNERTHRYGVWAIVVVILCTAFLLRFAAFDHPMAQNAGEGFRDLIVAEHAVLHGEWPLNGYYNGLSTIKNSPLYYYVLIVLASVQPTFLTTEVMYILFQCLFILGIFLLTRELFNTSAGLMASLIVALSPMYITIAATFVWPPHIAPPFVVFSLLALTYAYKKKRPYLVTVSIALMLMALAIHQSVLPVIPLFGILALYTAWRVFGSWSKYVFTAIVSISLLLLFFLPPIIFNNFTDISWGTRSETIDPTTQMEGLSKTYTAIPYAFGVLGNFPGKYKGVVATSSAVFLLWYLFTNTISRRKKVFLILLIVFVLIQIIASVLVDPEGIPRHFEPVFWMIPIIFAALFGGVLERTRFALPLVLVLCALIVQGSLTDNRLMFAFQNIPSFERPNYQIVEEATDAMAREIERLKIEKNKDNYLFFDAYGLGRTGFVVVPSIFWSGLERRLGTLLVRTNNSNNGLFETARSDKIFFLSCFQHSVEEVYTHEECVRDFEIDFPRHTVRDKIYEKPQLAVFVAYKDK